MKQLNNRQKIFNRILTRYLQSSDDKYFRKFLRDELDKSSLNFDIKDSAQLVIDFYQLLGKQNTSEKKEVKMERFNCRGAWQYQSIAYLQKQIEKRLKKFVDCSLVHGSFATGDFVNDWSDLDVKIILNDLVFKNKDNLKYVQKWLRKLSLICDKIDPLCHHRFSFLTTFDLDYYPNSFLPVVCYQYALVLTGRAKLKFHLRSDRQELLKQMDNFINHFRNKAGSKSKKNWKDDLSRVMLWPSLLLQTKGIYLYKKDSFVRVKKEFPEIDFSLIDQASDLRRNWRRCNLLKHYPDFLFILPFRINQIIINRFKAWADTSLSRSEQEKAELFIKKALKLFENEIR